MHSPSAPTSLRSSAARASSAITPSRSGATGSVRNVAPPSVETATCGSDASVQPPSVPRSRVPSGACASSSGPSGTGEPEGELLGALPDELPDSLESAAGAADRLPRDAC